MVRGSYTKVPEPASESRMKIRRSAGVNGMMSRIFCAVSQKINQGGNAGLPVPIGTKTGFLFMN